jgi:transposase
MFQFSGSTQAAVDYDSTIIGALELSEKKWVLAVQLPGVSRHSRHALEACGDGLASFVERLKAKCAAAGRKIGRVILTHEAGRDGFWLARFLMRAIREHLRRAALEALTFIQAAMRQGDAEAAKYLKPRGLMLGRYEVHLDRKLERMLTMLLRLKDLRQGAIVG